MMKVSLTTAGLLDPAQLQAWTRRKQQAIRAAVARGMNDGGRTIRDAVRAQMKQTFAVKRAGFINAMRSKVFARKPKELPALLIGSNVPWLGIHITGGTVRGPLLIPLLQKRIGPKAFRRVITDLLRTGNAFILKRNGVAIVMAENIAENGQALTRFRRAERLRTGAKRLRKGQELPIAVLVPRVSLRRRFDFNGLVQRGLPQLAQRIEAVLRQT